MSSLPVWIWPYRYPEGLQRRHGDEEHVETYGPGRYKGIIKGIPMTRSDGVGGQTSIRGADRFTIILDPLDYDGSQDFRAVLDFLQARKDADLEPFFFYSALENHVTATWKGDDPAGPIDDGEGNLVTEATGRYKVRHLDPIPWQLVKLKRMRVQLSFDQDLE